MGPAILVFPDCFTALGGKESTRLDLPPGLYFVELRWKGGELCEPYELKLVSHQAPESR